MDEFDELADAVAGNARERRAKRRTRPAPMRDADKRTPLSVEAPAPRLEGVIAERGAEVTKQALEAWSARVEGTPIVDIAHDLDISINLAKQLIAEVHTAIREDLKENLELNRQIDLSRIDGLLQTFYPQARQGDLDAAAVTLRALQHRSKLTGIEPLPAPNQNHPQSVLIWVQQQMPNIHKLVDSLPLEMPPSAP